MKEKSSMSAWSRFKNSSRTQKVRASFERFGRAMLMPVAVLPIMAIIGALGYIMISIGNKTGAMDNPGFKHFASSVKMIGMLPIYNLDILFAIGLAAGLAKTEKLSAALSGIMALIAFYFAGEILIKAAGLTTPKGSTITRFGHHSTGYDLNALGGILAGYIGYRVHKMTYKLQFPKAIAFFGGPKFSPVASTLVAYLVGFPLAYVWTYITRGMESMGHGIRSMGAGGAFLYGFTNRLLLPFGLHNVPNAVLRYTSAGGTWTDAAGTQYNGFYTILLAKVADGSRITVEDSMISNGTYPTNIFALPGAAVAMFLAVPKAKRKTAAPIIFGAVSSAVLSGVTEPIEFTFIFAAPILFFAHAIMTGLTYLIMYVSGAAMVSGTGEGLITWIAFNATGADHIDRVWMLWVLGPIFFFEYLAVFYFLIIKFNLKTPGRNDQEIKLMNKEMFRNKNKKTPENESFHGERNEDVAMAKELINLYGGWENINDVAACISRLRIEVKDKTKVQKEEIKNLGAAGVVDAGKQVQSVFGAKAMVYARIINLLNEEGE